jgi:hypothetical protein
MDSLKGGIMLEDKLEGTGRLICDRTGESWTVGYIITHSTEVVTLTRHPVTHRTSAVTVRTTANLADGQFTLETPEEFVLLQRVNGEWEIRV